MPTPPSGGVVVCAMPIDAGFGHPCPFPFPVPTRVGTFSALMGFTSFCFTKISIFVYLGFFGSENVIKLKKRKRLFLFYI
jgi:hypothetical protein